MKMQPRYMVVIYDAMGQYAICGCDSDEEIDYFQTTQCMWYQDKYTSEKLTTQICPILFLVYDIQANQMVDAYKLYINDNNEFDTIGEK